MQTENPVSHVLVPTGNQAILAAGNRPTSLAVGQLGIFNVHNGLSVDGSVLADTKDIYLAVGLNLTGAGGGATLEDIARSAGQMIQTERVKAAMAKAYVGPLPKIVEVGGYTAKCETDYVLKVEFRNNKSYLLNGYNQFVKTFQYYTACCDPSCASCTTSDGNDLSKGIIDAINADSDALVTGSLFVNRIQGTFADATVDGTVTVTVGAESFAVPVLAVDTATTATAKIAAFINAVTTSKYIATSSGAVLNVYPKISISNNTATLAISAAGGTGMTVGTVTTTNVDVTDLVTFKAGFTTVAGVPVTAIRLTANADNAAVLNAGIPIKYYNPRGVDMIVSLVEGFACNGTVTTIQEVQYEEGAGQEVQHMEYMANGWRKSGAYRTSAVTGLPRGDGEVYMSTASAKYSLFTLSYNDRSVTGARDSESNAETTVAIPCADTVTIQGLWTVLDLIFANRLGAMTNDVAGFDCTNVATHLINNVALDGIESLA